MQGRRIFVFTDKMDSIKPQFTRIDLKSYEEKIVCGPKFGRSRFTVFYQDRDEEAYLVGGQYLDQLVTKCESFDVNNNKWKTIGDLNDPRLNPGIMKTAQNLYVFGGASSVISLSHKNYKVTIEKLNLNGSSSFETIKIDMSKLDIIW